MSVFPTVFRGFYRDFKISLRFAKVSLRGDLLECPVFLVLLVVLRYFSRCDLYAVQIGLQLDRYRLRFLCLPQLFPPSSVGGHSE